MATITARLTVEQFLQLPEEQTLRCELVQGEIVPMSNAARGHELAKANFIDHLVTYNLEHRLGKVFSETMYRIRSSEARVLKEDQYLEEPGLLPGFRVLVSNFFEGI